MEWNGEILFIIALAIFVHGLIYFLVVRKKPKSINGKHVLITGGSKGIGLCLAVECARRGANVTVVARDEKMLSKCTQTNIVKKIGYELLYYII